MEFTLTIALDEDTREALARSCDADPDDRDALKMELLDLLRDVLTDVKIANPPDYGDDDGA